MESALGRLSARCRSAPPEPKPIRRGRMTDQKRNPEPPNNTQKDPDEWVTGDETMTGAQASYLKTLADEAGEDVRDDLTKAEASKKIDELQERTGRGRDH